MPTFCRHNRLVQNCSICAREQAVELRPAVTPGGRPEPRPRPAAAPRASTGNRRGTASRTAGGGRTTGVTVRRLAREADDGYVSALVPGLHAEAAAARLADDLAVAAARLTRLTADPPGLYAEVADTAGDPEERLWLAVQIAVIGPLDAGAGEDPFAEIRAVRTTWTSGEVPSVTGEQVGPRGAADPGRALTAYRAWVQRQGGQVAGLTGEAGWAPERRFDRVFERLGTLAGMERGPRYDLLVTLGRLGVVALHGTRLHLGGSDPVTLAAKRVLGIGDPLLLERRSADLADACALELEALDLGFFAWERRTGTTGGLPDDTEADPEQLGAVRAALGLI